MASIALTGTKPSNKLVEALIVVHKLLPKGITLSKGGVGEIAAAFYLGHTLTGTDKGPDGYDSEGNFYEYKVCTKDSNLRFNFHMGSRRDSISGWTVEEHIRDKFKNIKGCYCLVRDGMDIIDGEYIPVDKVIEICLDYQSKSFSQQINPNFVMSNIRRRLHG
jgi:hypothetical protein